MKYTTVLFDADDTLLDFKLAERKALIEALNFFGLPYNDEIVSTYSEINDGFWKLLEIGDVTKEELKYKRFAVFCNRFAFDVDHVAMAERYVENLAEQSVLIDGADSLVKSLYGKCRLYVITNGISYIQRRRLEKSAIYRYFDGIFVSEEIGFEKPSFDFFRLVTAQIENFDKENTVVVGDSLTSDIKGGIDFGIDTCWYNPKGKQAPPNMDITYKARKFEEIYAIIEGE